MRLFSKKLCVLCGSATWLFLSALLCALAFSPGARAESLLDIYRLAADYDPQLKQAEASYQAVTETRDQTRAQLLPQTALSANLTRDRQEVTSSSTALFPPDTFYSTTRTYAVNLSQALYRRDLFVQLQQSSASAAQAEALYKAAARNLIVRVGDRYFDVLAAADNLAFARAETKANQRLLEQAQQRFQVGMIAVTDVQEAQAAYDLAAAREIAAENSVATAREGLREVTGRFHESLRPLKADVSLTAPDPANVDAWADTALKQNLQLLAAQYGVEMAQQEVELGRAGHYPRLDAVASYGYSDAGASRFGSSESNDTTLGLRLTLPLYEGGGVAARVRAAGYRLTQSREALEQQRRAAERQTRSAYLEVINAINSVKALKQALTSTQGALQTTQAGYEVGTRTLTDVLQSQRDVFDAERNYARARYNYLTGSLHLKDAAGVLSPADVEDINRWLE